MITAVHCGTKGWLEQCTVGQRNDYSSAHWDKEMITTVHSETRRLITAVHSGTKRWLQQCTVGQRED